MPEGVRKGSLYQLLGLGAGGAFLFLFNVIAARKLGPSGYGIMSVLYSLITVITPLLAGGIRLGTIKFISTFEARNEKYKIQATIRNSVVFLIPFLVLFLMVALVIRDPIKDKYLNHSFFLFLIFILSVFLRSFASLVRGVIQGLREFKYNIITIGIEYFSMLLFLLGSILFFGLGINGACTSLLSAQAITLVAGFLICHRFKSRLKNNKKNEDSWGLRNFSHFVVPVAFSNFLSFFLFRSGPFLIKTLAEVDADKLAGLFASAFALVSVLRMLVESLSGALFPNLSRAEALRDVRLQKRYIKNSILFVTGMSITMTLIFWLLGPSILRVVYGKEFLLKRLDIFLIASMGGLYFSAQLLNTILFAKGLTTTVLISWSIGTIFLISFLWSTRIEPLLRVETGLCLANLVAFVLMMAVLKTRFR